MTIEKITRPDALLFRFDPDSETPKLRGCAYYDRTFYVENGVEIPESSKENPAQAVSIAQGVPGLDLDSILGTLTAGAVALAEQQAVTIADLTVERDKLRIVVNAFAAETEPSPTPKDPGPGSAAEPSLEP